MCSPWTAHTVQPGTLSWTAQHNRPAPCCALHIVQPRTKVLGWRVDAQGNSDERKGQWSTACHRLHTVQPRTFMGRSRPEEEVWRHTPRSAAPSSRG